MFSFYCWFTSNLEFCFLQIVLENAAPIANDMVAADPSSTVVHSLRRKQNSLHFAFQIFFFLKRLNFCHVSCLFKIKKESECFSFSLFVLVPYVSFMSSPSHMTVALPNSYSHHSSVSTRLRIQKQEHYQKKKNQYHEEGRLNSKFTALLENSILADVLKNPNRHSPQPRIRHHHAHL